MVIGRGVGRTPARCAGAGRREPGARRRRSPFRGSHRAASDPASWLLAFRTAIERNVPVADSTLTWIGRHVGRRGAEDFVATPAQRQATRDMLRPRPGSTRGCPRCTTAGCSAGCSRSSRRSHCRVVRDFYHKYTVDEHTLLTIRNLERLLDADRAEPRALRRRCCRSSQRPSCWCWRCCSTTSASGRDDDHAAESVRMAQAMLDRLELADRGARDGRVPDPQSPADVAGRVPPRHRGSARSSGSSPTLVGTEERLKMLCLMTLADVEAVSPDTLTPWKEELLWRLYVDTYNQLTLGYGDELHRPGPGRAARRCSASRPDDITGDGDHALPRRAAAALPAAVRPDAIYRHVAAGARHPPGRSARCSLEQQRRRLGADRRHARQAVPVLEHLAACCRTSAWTSCAATP